MKRTAKGALTPPEKVKHTKPPAATGFRCSHKVAQTLRTRRKIRCLQRCSVAECKVGRAQSVKAISFLPAKQRRETRPSSRGGPARATVPLSARTLRFTGAAKPENDESVEGIFSEKERLRELKHLRDAGARSPMVATGR